MTRRDIFSHRWRSMLVLAALVLIGSSWQPGQAAELAPLKLYWSSARTDNHTTGTAAGEQAAKASGYHYARTQGYILTSPRSGTKPLKLYYHDTRKDNFTTATPEGEWAAESGSYRFVRIVGYVFTTPRSGTVPLKLFWHSGRKDNFSTATPQGEYSAQVDGYRFVRIQGYVYPKDRPKTCLDYAARNHTIDHPGTVFDSHRRLGWTVPRPSGCTDLQVYLTANGSTSSVPATGSRNILPLHTTTYRLWAKHHGHIRTLAYTTVLRAKIISYPQAEDRWGSQGMAVRFAQLILDNLPEANRRRFRDWRIEIHVIPASLMLTELDGWETLVGEETDNPADGNRNYDSLRGVGGVRNHDTRTIYMAIGEEQVRFTPGYPTSPPPSAEREIGYMMIHEMGHTIMGHAHSDDEGNSVTDFFALTGTQGNRLLAIYNARLTDPNADWLGVGNANKDYTKSNAMEYFAESVAAYFGLAQSVAEPGDYTPQWLQMNDPAMYDLLDEIFGCDGQFPTTADPVCQRG